MTTQEEICPQFQEYLGWVEKEAMPRYREFAAHFANCSKCQKLIFEMKDQMAFNLLRTSNEQLIERAKEIAKEK